VKLGATLIEDTFAEAFGMRFARLVVTAIDDRWRRTAAACFAGYATSVIGCDCEAGVEHYLPPEHSPDGRPGVALLAFGFSDEGLAQAVGNRTAQTLLTCPTTAVFDGLPEASRRIPLGKRLRFFGDGYQKSKLFDGQRFWRVPVMDGECLLAESLGTAGGVGGGNLIIQGADQATTLAAAQRAVAAVADQPGVIAPFPGGVVRSGSKVGSRYKKLRASTAEAFCPTLRGRVPTQLDPAAHCAYEVVFDGVDPAAIVTAMTTAIRAAAGEGVVAVSAGNYGGKLGKFQFHLRELIAGHTTAP
jgi:formylmethanofuran--tetrahydromethanopterin N-formyltransferase